MLTGHRHAVAWNGHQNGHLLFAYHDLDGLDGLDDESSTVAFDDGCLLSATGCPGDSTDELPELPFGHLLLNHPYSHLAETLSSQVCISAQSPPSLAVTSPGPGLQPK